MRSLYYALRAVFELCALPFLVLAALCARVMPKKIDVGLGPFPLINNVYHKDALRLAGYSAETFVAQVWHITSQFDVRFDQHRLSRNVLTRKFLLNLWIFAWSAFRYRAIVVYFDGGPFGQGTAFLWRLEPQLYRIAGVHTVVLPYGSDVQAMSRSVNLQFKHAMSVDYRNHRTRHAHIVRMIDLWTANASHIVGGCEWVDYMHHWDTLMISHFSIALPEPAPAARDSGSGPLKLLHAPNHREIKGTRHILRAVEELRQEGLDIELVLVERVPNVEVRRLILEADVIVDQLVIGWYAMFAIEAMASCRPVICHLRQDLESLYVATGLLDSFNEIPILRADAFTIKDLLRKLHDDRELLARAGLEGRRYVQRRHSVQAISMIFGAILSGLIGSRQEQNTKGVPLS